MREGGQALRDRIALGVLTATFPPAVVDEAIEAAAKRERRYRLLPARVVVYYVLAMSLFRACSFSPTGALVAATSCSASSQSAALSSSGG